MTGILLKREIHKNTDIQSEDGHVKVIVELEQNS